MPYLDKWAFKAFCLSTVFVLFFSIEAIHHWPAFIKRFFVLFACILPAGMVILPRIPAWLKARQIPEEIIWVLLLLILGLISALFSVEKWTALKSIILFIAAGPLIFVGSKYLFESTRNQEAFLWMNSLVLLALCFFGIYEHNYNQSDYDAVLIFSGNPLPAGTLLILLSASPMILWCRQDSPALKFLLALGLALSVVLIVLSAKKSHLLGLVTILLSLIIFKNRRWMKFLLEFILLSGILLYTLGDSLLVRTGDRVFTQPDNSGGPVFNEKGDLVISGSMRYKYKAFTDLNNGVVFRAENYFFALHVLKKNPVWGVGFKSDLAQHLDDYDIRFSDKISKSQYQAFIESEKTFENIVLAFLVEWGCLFSFFYFGGLVYVVIACWRKIRVPSENVAGILIVSVMVGFAIISLTFDTLRLPNLNWAFHSLLGLLANTPPKSLDGDTTTLYNLPSSHSA